MPSFPRTLSALRATGPITLSRVAGLMGLGGVVVILLGLGALTYDQRRQSALGTDKELRATATFLADHASRLFEVADVALRGAAGASADANWDALERSESLFRQLRDLKSTLPYVEDVWLNDSAGRLRLTTFAFPAPFSDASDRDAFRAQREPNDRLFIGAPIVGRVTGAPTFLLARRMENRADGSFRGMVSVTASLAYFSDYWRRLDLPLDARVRLVRADDLTILAQQPPSAEAGDQEIPRQAEFRQVLAEDPRSGRYTGGSEAAPRRGAYQQVGDLPLYVRVSVSEEAIEAAWRSAVLPYAAAALAALVALALLTFIAFRQARREALASAELEAKVVDRTRVLAQREEELRLIVEGAADNVILTTDPEGRIITWSPGAEVILGWPAKDVRGEPFKVIFTPEDREAGVPEHELRTARVKGYAPDQRWHLRRDGTRVFLSGSVRPLKDAAGRERGYVKVAHDETERRRAADALQSVNSTLERRVAERTADLEAANRRLEAEMHERQEAEGQLRQVQKMEAMGHLTGGLAHDFNNMLAVVISGLTLIQKRLRQGQGQGQGQDGADLTRFVDAAMDGATRAATLTARLLAFSRQQPLAPDLVDVNRLVAGMSELLRRTLGEEVRMETVLAGGLWPVHADAGQVENAILNLAVNARDAMSGGGRLTIETTNCHLDEAYAQQNPDVAPGQYVQIAVTDTGSGMPPKVIARAFDPFFTTKAVGKGTGLGLSMVYGFVKQSGGHVKIYSEPGEGTTVKIYLPRSTGQAQRALLPEVAGDAGPLPRGDVREIVLVVEDEQRVRDMAVASLRELGYTVLHAQGAAEALSVLDAHPEVTLLFTDIVMPEVNGRKLAAEARRRRPDLKVLFTTGFSRNAVVHNGMVDPGVNFLAKPFTLQQLASKVREVVGAPAP